MECQTAASGLGYRQRYCHTVSFPYYMSHDVQETQLNPLGRNCYLLLRTNLRCGSDRIGGFIQDLCVPSRVTRTSLHPFRVRTRTYSRRFAELDDSGPVQGREVANEAPRERARSREGTSQAAATAALAAATSSPRGRMSGTGPRGVMRCGLIWPCDLV